MISWLATLIAAGGLELGDLGPCLSLLKSLSLSVVVFQLCVLSHCVSVIALSLSFLIAPQFLSSAYFLIACIGVEAFQLRYWLHYLLGTAHKFPGTNLRISPAVS